MIYPSFGAEERRGEEMGRRLIRSPLEFTCQEANAEERERQRSWNFFVSSKEEDVTAGGNRIITS